MDTMCELSIGLLRVLSVSRLPATTVAPALLGRASEDVESVAFQLGKAGLITTWDPFGLSSFERALPLAITDAGRARLASLDSEARSKRRLQHKLRVGAVVVTVIAGVAKVADVVWHWSSG